VYDDSHRKVWLTTACVRIFDCDYFSGSICTTRGDSAYHLRHWAYGLVQSEKVRFSRDALDMLLTLTKGLVYDSRVLWIQITVLVRPLIVCTRLQVRENSLIVILFLVWHFVVSFRNASMLVSLFVYALISHHMLFKSNRFNVSLSFQNPSGHCYDQGMLVVSSD